MPWKYMAKWKYSCTILDLDTRWRLGGGQLRALAALPPGKEPSVPIQYKAGGPQSQSKLCGVEKNLLPIRNRTAAIQPVPHRCTNSATLALIWKIKSEQGELYFSLQWLILSNNFQNRIKKNLVLLLALSHNCSEVRLQNVMHSARLLLVNTIHRIPTCVTLWVCTPVAGLMNLHLWLTSKFL
jgi:hypothetical protein